MIQQRISIYILSTVLFFFQTSVFSKEITIGFSKDLPPYTMHDKGTLTGIDIEIVKKSFQTQGYSVKAKQYSYDEFYLALKNAEVAATSTTIPIETESQQFFYSKPYLKFENLVITRKKDHIKINSLSDLKNISIVGWYKAYRTLGKKFEQIYSPYINANKSNLYHENVNQFNQVKAFFEGKEQAIVIDLYVFLWFQQQLLEKGFTEAKQAVDYHWIFPKETTVYSMAFRDKNLQETFDKGLDEIRNSGQIQAIEKRFLNCENYNIPHVSKNCMVQTKK